MSYYANPHFEGLGITAQQGIQTTAGTVLAFAPMTGAAAPFVAAAGAVMELASMIGRGCGQPCINAAQTEQIYEAAADNIYAVCKAGMLDGSIGSQLCQQLASEADAAEAQLNTAQGQAGESNASKVISNVASACASIGPATAALDLSSAAALYKQPGTSGWYASSLTQAVNLTNQILSAIAPSLPSPGTASTNATPNGAAAAAMPAAPMKWLLIGGVALAAAKFTGVI